MGIEVTYHKRRKAYYGESEDEPTKVEFYLSGNIKEEKYCENGKLHRMDKPAVIKYYENGGIRQKSYYLNDKLHREDGPAIICYHENGTIEGYEYFIQHKLIGLTNKRITRELIMSADSEFKLYKYKFSLLSDKYGIKLLSNKQKDKDELLELVMCQLVTIKLLD